MEQIRKEPNRILEQSVRQVCQRLGSRLDKITVERAVLGLFFTGVKLSTGHGGLCFTPIKEIPGAVCCPSSASAMPLSGRLKGRPVREYLDDIFCGSVLRKTLGIAALNALSSLIWDLEPPVDYTIECGQDAFDVLDLQKAQQTVVVGALVPILRRLLAEERPFHVLEQDIRTLKHRELEHYAPPEAAPELIPQADLLVITGVTILNDTLPELLALAKPGAEIVVTGPTASMLPDALFAAGVTMSGGILVTNADEALELLSEGGSGYHLFGKSVQRTVIRAHR